MVAQAAERGAGALIVDPEDAVAPPRTARARQILRDGRHRGPGWSA